MTCAPGTHFHRPTTTGGRFSCVYCGQTPTPPPPRPRCSRCHGTGIQSFAWHGPGATLDYWVPETCTECAGTGRPT